MTTAPTPVRRTVALAAAVITAALTGAVVPVATGVAHAADPTQTQFLVVDRDGSEDAFFGLYRRATPDGPLSTVVAETGLIDVESVSASRDGSRFVDVETLYDANVNRLRSKVVVRDVSGRTVQVVEDVTALGVATYSAILSPDGNTVVWNRYEASTGLTTVRRMVIGSSAATVVASGMDVHTFLDATTILAIDYNSGWVARSLNTTATASFSDLTADVLDPVVSPDGNMLVWSLDVAENFDAAVTDVQVAPLTRDEAGFHVGTPVTIASGMNNTDASFADATTVMYVHDDGMGGTGEAFSAPVDDNTDTGGTPLDSDIGDVWSQAMGTTDDGTAPSTATLLPATLTGTTATLRWTRPTELDVSGVLITRTLGATTTPAVYVPLPVTSRLDTGLVLGSTYTYTIKVVDRSGNIGAATTRQLTALLAKPTVYDPTSTGATRAPFLVRFAASSPPGVKFTVEYRSNSNRTFGPWITNVAGATRTFGSAAATGVVATTSVLGRTYQFRVRGTDAFGNTTPTVASVLPVVPFDHTRATFVGGSTVLSTAAWMGSYRYISTTAQKATVSTTGNRFQLVGWRCTSCGGFFIYEGSTLVGTVDTYATASKPRTVLFTRTWTTVATRTLTIKPRGTSGRPKVIIDGFAIRSVV